ncbi:hypothetical protein BH11CYA1_BH11CYA1_21070 [soil metagenome]
MEPHLSAELTLLGMACDLVGGLYLAYDLFGGEKGPLSTITRLVNYSLLMIAGFLFPLGPKFALIAGIGLGSAFGLHIDRIGKGKPDTFGFLIGIGALRAVTVILALWVADYKSIAIVLGPCAMLMTLLSKKLRITPAEFYQSDKKPHLKKAQLLIALALGVLAIATSLIGASIGMDSLKAAHFGIKLGLTFAGNVLIVTTLSPMIEWYADNLPDRSFGFAGAILFMTGFLIQAIPSLVTMFDIVK